MNKRMMIMASIKSTTAALLIAVPLAGTAEISAADIPGETVWYMHADLEQMRTTESGQRLYGWLDGEIFVEINDHIGIDLNEEIDRVTAFSDTPDGATVVVEGPFRQEFREQILAAVRSEGELESRDHNGKTYYRATDPELSGNARISFENTQFFSFAVAGKLIVAADEERIREMIDNNGRVAGSGAAANTLFVLTADKDFVQAGMRTDQFADDDDDWDSNILRNTEQASLLVSDQGGMIAVEAKLVATDPTVTQSLGNIVNGLIALQAFNSDLDPEVLSLLQNTKVEAVDNVLSISTVLDPDSVLSVLED